MAGTAIRAPVKDLDNHQIIITQMKEILETAQGLRGDPLDAFVKIRDLVSAGLINYTSKTISPNNPKDTQGVKFANLPQGPKQGQRAFIVDSNSTTFLAAAAGGGTNKVPVVWNGTAWVIG